MNYTQTDTGYDVFFDFAGETYRVGSIHLTETVKPSYSYTDRLFHPSVAILHSHSLSHLKDTISAYYSSRDSIGAIEDRWL